MSDNTRTDAINLLAASIVARAEKGETERDEWSEQFGGLAECGGEGVDCDIHPVTLVDHEGPVSCVWCALDAAQLRAKQAEAAIERVRELAQPAGEPTYDEQGNYLCLSSGRPEKHRTVGLRAWTDGEWCYPHAPCEDCEPRIDREELREALDGEATDG